MKHPALIILKALLEGHTIKMKYAGHDRDISMEDGMFGEWVDVYKGGETYPSEQRFMKYDIDISSFIKLCEEMPSKDLICIAANIVLTEMSGKTKEELIGEK